MVHRGGRSHLSFAIVEARKPQERLGKPRSHDTRRKLLRKLRCALASSEVREAVSTELDSDLAAAHVSEVN